MPNTIQHSLRFSATQYPRLTEKRRTCARGEFTCWLCQLGEAALDPDRVTLDRIYRVLQQLTNSPLKTDSLHLMVPSIPSEPQPVITDGTTAPTDLLGWFDTL